MTSKIDLPVPLWIGRCVVNTELVSAPYQAYESNGSRISGKMREGYAGVRFISPSASDENVYIPAADVYMCLKESELQQLSAYFSSLARKVGGKE